MDKVRELLILFAILIIAFYFRFNNLNWDNNHHLHPDERFLTMVGGAMQIPASLKDYLDPQISTMNPANIGYKFFVYGLFPITLNKNVAIYFEKDNYDDFTIIGRKLSALFDLLVIILIYKIAKILLSKTDNWKLKTEIPLWSAFIYSIMVLPIQLAHFFTVDTFLNFFMLASFYCALRFNEETRHASSLLNLILSAIFLGLALGSKITALFILPLNLYFICNINKIKRPHQLVINPGKLFIFAIGYLVLSYFVLRLANPYMFESFNFFDPRPATLFVDNLKELKNMTKIEPGNYFPPMIQWLNKNTIVHSVVNNAIFGLGLPIFITVITGIVGIILNIKYKISKIPIKNKIETETIQQFSNIAILFIWVFFFSIYQSLQTTPTLRYFIIIYPFLAIFAAVGLSVISSRLSVINQKLKIGNLFFLTTEYLLLTVILLVWPVMFSSIYSNNHTRVEASEWIYKNFKNGSVIANEHWDDGLPLPMVNNYGKEFIYKELPVFGIDNEEKWQEMNKVFSESDYYILSSNRGWGSIPTVPEKFPRMTKFYQDLFAGNSEFKKIAEFTSYPGIALPFPLYPLRLTLPDDWADEAFTVYDHPKVMIFKKYL